MKICVIGTGYVGLVVGTCPAYMRNNIIFVTNEDFKKFEFGIVPIFELGL